MRDHGDPAGELMVYGGGANTGHNNLLQAATIVPASKKVKLENCEGDGDGSQCLFDCFPTD